MGLVTANPSKPKRANRGLIASPPVDLTVSVGGVAGAINPGELCYLSNTNKVASLNTPGASNANAAKCIGVADSLYPVVFTDGITGSPVPASDASPALIQMYEDGDHLFNTTAADSYQPYDLVYLGANGRTIQKTASGTSVGYVSPDQRAPGASTTASPGSFPITGAAGVMIYIRIQPALAK